MCAKFTVSVRPSTLPQHLLLCPIYSYVANSEIKILQGNTIFKVLTAVKMVCIGLLGCDTVCSSR
jgi:hypothetical protein